jgi:hypothetical protein
MEEEVLVVEVLKGFMSEMRDWETAFRDEQMSLINEDKDTSNCDKKYELELKRVLAKFSVSDERSWARLVDLGCGSPPTYDPVRDVINKPVQVGKNYAVVVEQMARLKAVYKFFLKKTDNGWLIVKKETKNGDKWKKTAL